MLTPTAIIICSIFIALVFIEFIPALCIRALMLYLLRSQTQGKLIITYDDGPGKRLEPKLLEVLREHSAKATFFLNGRRAKSSPERCVALLADGHELGFHAYDHLNGWRVSQWSSIREIIKTRKVLSPWVERASCHRFPYGKFTTSMWLVSTLLGSKTIHWTVDSGDTHTKLPQQDMIVDKVVRARGGVVLMHSFDRENDIECENYVLSLTEALLKAAKINKLQVCTCSSF